MGKFIVLLAFVFVLFSMGCVQEAQEPVACTLDAKICPDGTAVGRIPPDCDFAPCPSASTDTPPPEHYPETPVPTFKPGCVEGEMKHTTCPDGVTTYFSENCVDGEWVQVKYIRDPCAPLPMTQPPEETTWVEIDPIQCLGNPWEQDWLESHNNDYASYPRDDEFEVIKDYYEKQGIAIFDVKSERKYEIVCEACSCPRGDSLSLLVSDSDVGVMLELGYKISSYT
jgi:hypothetical protein